MCVYIYHPFQPLANDSQTLGVVKRSCRVPSTDACEPAAPAQAMMVPWSCRNVGIPCARNVMQLAEVPLAVPEMVGWIINQTKTVHAKHVKF